MGLGRINLTWLWANLNRHGSESNQIDMGPSQLGWTYVELTRLDIASLPTRPWPSWLDLDLSRLGNSRLSSTWAQTDSTRHWPESTQIDMHSDWLGSTWAQADSYQTSTQDDSNRHRPRTTRIDIGSGRLRSTSARLVSGRHPPEPTQLDMGLGWLTWVVPIRLDMGLDQLGSTWSRGKLARHGLKPSWLNIVTGRLGSTWSRTDSDQHGPRSTSISTSARTESARHGLGPNQIDMGPSRLGWTYVGLTRVGNDSTRHGPVVDSTLA